MFYYTIQRGDTIYKLSNFFDVSMQEIMDANPMVNPYNLIIGQQLIIPISKYLYENYPWYYLYPYLFIRFPRNYWNDRRRWPRRQPGRDDWPDRGMCMWPGRDDWTQREDWTQMDRQRDTDDRSNNDER